MIADIEYQTAAAAADDDIIVEERDGRRALRDLSGGQFENLSRGLTAAFDIELFIVENNAVRIEHIESGYWLLKPNTITVCDAWAAAARLSHYSEGGAE
jgi:hypothetical protein